jgi:hypothetical protein
MPGSTRKLPPESSSVAAIGRMVDRICMAA